MRGQHLGDTPSAEAGVPVAGDRLRGEVNFLATYAGTYPIASGGKVFRLLKKLPRRVALGPKQAKLLGAFQLDFLGQLVGSGSGAAAGRA
jgi:hypothetical protein